jgi:2-polyprenyl-6-hydroxyphenyl methylase / 3-demethylubiquinone-9 3-methyltransferase
MNKRQNQRLAKLLQNVGDMALKRRAKLMIDGLELEDGDKVLDVGCGDAFYLHLLSNLGMNLKLYGTDVDTAALESAKKNLRGKNIQFKIGDLMKKLPYDDNTFDKVVMSEVAEHLPNDVKGLKEVLRVLKPGGIISLSVPNANYPFLWDPPNWILERAAKTHIKQGFWAGIWNQHIRLYTVDQMKKAMQKAGFKVETAKAVTWWSLPFNHHIINMVARMLYREGGSPELVASMSKYETKDTKPTYMKFLFGVVNINDKLNNLVELKNIGQGVYIKAKK